MVLGSELLMWVRDSENRTKDGKYISKLRHLQKEADNHCSAMRTSEKIATDFRNQEKASDLVDARRVIAAIADVADN